MRVVRGLSVTLLKVIAFSQNYCICYNSLHSWQYIAYLSMSLHLAISAIECAVTRLRVTDEKEILDIDIIMDCEPVLEIQALYALYHEESLQF